MTKSCLLWLVLVGSVYCDLNPVVKRGLSYGKDISFEINNTIEYILEFSGPNLLKPPRVTVISEGATRQAPLMVVARQTKQLLSWQVPLEVESPSGHKNFSRTARTLCHDILKERRLLATHKFTYDSPIITLSTGSESNIDFTVNVDFQDYFTIEPSQEYVISISPSEPRYYFYEFIVNTSRSAHSDYDTVILEVNSNDTICTTVSIQNVTCPVFDLNQDITFRGFYETITVQGSITIPKYKFPFGFYIVFVAKGDDYDCTKAVTSSVNSNRTKTITFTVKPSITYQDYVNAVIWTLGSIGAFYIVFGLAFLFCSYKYSMPRQMQYVSNQSTPINENSGTEQGSGDGNLDSQSIDETDYDTLEEIRRIREIRLCRTQPFLCDLARRDLRVLKKRSYLYLYNVLTVALFYGLPVIQLVITYQRVLNETGEQDLCYYNFLCAHPVGFLSDFNHVFSNIGYVLLGFLFVLITYHREMTHKDLDFDRQFGIPQHYGLFYAMGVALIMEGVLSGSYHVCPSRVNFQFDSSFMYVMAVLCMVKLYQNRHPDINATAYMTFGVLSLAIFLGMVGIMEGTLGFWIFFVVLHILACFYLSVEVYYMGCYRLGKDSFRRIYDVLRHDFWSGPLNVLKPCYKARFILLVIGNLCNYAMAFAALYHRPKNFAIFLLAVFMANTLLYFIFYIAMKYVHKERVKLLTWLFLGLSLLCATTAMYCFVQKSISNSKTPAESRAYNKECLLLRFYDYHDIWHFLSAVGMFFLFMVLLTLDDDLSHTHHDQIPVF